MWFCLEQIHTEEEKNSNLNERQIQNFAYYAKYVYDSSKLQILTDGKQLSPVIISCVTVGLETAQAFHCNIMEKIEYFSRTALDC